LCRKCKGAAAGVHNRGTLINLAQQKHQTCVMAPETPGGTPRVTRNGPN
jgi:hypothetical protein